MLKHFLGFINHCREHVALRLFYWVIRIGFSLAFVLSGVRKLPGIKFTQIPMFNPDGSENLVGLYFHAMYQTGFYWHFIGYLQIVLGIVLLTNRFATLALILMMPITINICLVSFALDMSGTPIITSFMVLGNAFLILWHYEAYLSILDRAKHTTLKSSGKN